MGLDVYLIRPDQERISWNDPIVQANGFPFERYEEKITEYNNPDDPNAQTGEFSQFSIAEICGMPCVGGVSFRGRGYDNFAMEELPHSFYSNMLPEQLKAEATALSAWLENHRGAPPNEEYHGESLQELCNLSILLNWAVEHGLGTYASH